MLRIVVILCLCTLLTGCTLEDSEERGESCPPQGHNGRILYIGEESCTYDHWGSCTLSTANGLHDFDFSSTREYRSCPVEYSLCTAIVENDIYACEMDYKLVTSCKDDMLKCSVGNGVRCIDPGSPAHCGASNCKAEKNFGGTNCFEFSPLSKCRQNSYGGYQCYCPDDGLLCNGHCIKTSDKFTCGANDCDADNYGGDDCTQYANHRECKADKNGSYSCQSQSCRENQCQITRDDGVLLCTNTDEQCGPECLNCLDIHAGASCLNGTCVIDTCSAGEHPVFSGTHISKCIKNSANSCAPQSMTVDGSIVNCDENKPEHAAEMGCSATGTCYITRCDDGFMLSSDSQSCMPGQSVDCSDSQADCAGVEHAEQTACSEASLCTVVSCKPGYFLNVNHTGCIQAMAMSCAGADGDKPVDCTEIPNAVTTSCTENGVCRIMACLSGYSLNTDGTQCTVAE